MRGRALVWIIVLCGLGIGAAVLGTYISWTRTNFGTAQCTSNLKFLAGDLRDYVERNGGFSAIVNADRAELYPVSWRVRMLPLLGRDDLYRRYRFDEAWNGPNNRKLIPECPNTFRCPLDHSPRALGWTNYLLVTGPHTLVDTSRPAPSIMHDPALMLVEVLNARIPWTEPRDLHIDDITDSEPLRAASGMVVSSRHLPVINVAFSDGSVRYLPTSVSLIEFRDLASPHSPTRGKTASRLWPEFGEYVPGRWLPGGAWTGSYPPPNGSDETAPEPALKEAHGPEKSSERNGESDHEP